MTGNSIGSLQLVAPMTKSAKEIQAPSELWEEEKINTQNTSNKKMSRKARFFKIKIKDKKPFVNRSEWKQHRGEYCPMILM